MCPTKPNSDLLDKLIDTVCDIDENKTSAKCVLYLATVALELIEQGQQKEPVNIGRLVNIFSEIQTSCKNVEQLPYLIDQAHVEIKNVLTTHAWQAYLKDVTNAHSSQ